MPTDFSDRDRPSVLSLARAVGDGHLAIGAAIDLAFRLDVWASHPAAQRQQFIEEFFKVAGDEHPPALADGELFFLFYTGLKVEDSLHETNGELARQVLSLILRNYPASPSHIVANAFRLHLEETFKSRDDHDAYLEAIDCADRGVAVLPADAQRELRYALLFMAGALRTQLVLWMRHARRAGDRHPTVAIDRHALLATALANLRASLALLLPDKEPSPWAANADLLVNTLLVDSPAPQAHLEEARLLCER